MRKPYKETIQEAMDGLTAKQWSKTNRPSNARDRACRWARLEKLERYRVFANRRKGSLVPTARDHSSSKFVGFRSPIYLFTEKGPLDVQ